MKGIAVFVATLAILSALGLSAPSLVTKSDPLGVSVASGSMLAKLAEGYKNTEMYLNYELEKLFAEHNLGTPRAWVAMTEGYVANVMGLGMDATSG